MTRTGRRARWRPLLRGPLAKAALEAVDAVADDIAETARRSSTARDASLGSGAAGLAVFHAYRSRARARADGEDAASRLLEEAGDAVATVTMGSSLFGGFTGVAWAMAHLQGRFFEPDGGESTEAIDEALVGYVRRPDWREEYDLISGLVGIGVYAVERLPTRAAISCLAGVVDRLEETAVRRPEGLAWHTRPELLPPHQRKECPAGYDNLGLAHGVPGVIAILGAAYAAGVRKRTARRLLEGAVPWLLRQKLDGSPGARFPAWAAEEQEHKSCRSAWCYGDPGVSVALFGAARSVGNRDWEREALALARASARRPPAQSGVVDAGLCHGSAGLAHIYNRMYQATGDVTLRSAARNGFERTLAMRRPGRGVGGFSARYTAKGGKETWKDEPCLFGAAGIALALLSAATAIEPEWDRAFLMSTGENRTATIRRRRPSTS